MPIVRSIRLSADVTLPYVEHGDPNGIPLLLLHGVTDSWRSFESVLPLLPGSIRAIAPTQRGHGNASRPRDGYTFAALAADVAALLDALRIPAAFVCGHSMGSGVAQRFAADHPKRVLGLVLVGSFHDLRKSAAARELWDASISTLEDPVDPGFVRGFQESTLARPIPQAFLDAAIEESLQVPARVWRAAFEGFLHDDVADRIGSIEAPTQIVWGALDALCSRDDQQALLAAIPRSRLTIYAEAGHSPHWEEPERFARDLAAFVTRSA